MNILWLPDADNDLIAIMEYISKENSDIAEIIVSKIIISAKLLSNSPGIGRPGRVKSTRELVLLEIPYIIAYRVSNLSVEILRVLHQSRRWPIAFE